MATNVRLFTTCPPSAAFPGSQYLERVKDVARWSDEFGFEGILVYTDNRLVDPWLVSQVILQSTHRLCPLIAVQPLYMHPYAAATMVTSLAFLHGRRIHLNMVAGGFSNDLAGLNDNTAHDQRYERLVEYTRVLKALLCSPGPISFEGAFYRLSNVRLLPSLPAELVPDVMISGSSPAGLAAADAIEAIAVRYPAPAQQEPSWNDSAVRNGVRLGIIARNTDEEAWDVAHTRFPPDRKGEIAHQIAMKTSDSVWHRQLSDLAARLSSRGRHPYWLVPFQMYKTFCPYLVGSHYNVGAELREYIRRGYTDFILDVPPDRQEIEHNAIAFRCAMTWDERHAPAS